MNPRLLITIYWIAAAVAVSTGLFIGWLLFKSEPAWNPLGDYPVQAVADQGAEPRGTWAGPVVVIGEDAKTTGIKCNATNGPVNVNGSFGWRITSPVIEVFPVGEGSGQRRAGCEEFIFNNTPPDELVELATELYNDGQTVIAEVTGTETPTRQSGEGVPRTWRTELFQLVLE